MPASSPTPGSTRKGTLRRRATHSTSRSKATASSRAAARGTNGYTRAGTLKTDAQGRIVTAEGYPLEPPIIDSRRRHQRQRRAGRHGERTSRARPTRSRLGQTSIASFVNPAGLASEATTCSPRPRRSGDPRSATRAPTAAGRCCGQHRARNVEVVEEMIGLIAAQRNYEINSKVITAADEMLRNATQMR